MPSVGGGHSTQPASWHKDPAVISFKVWCECIFVKGIGSRLWKCTLLGRIFPWYMFCTLFLWRSFTVNSSYCACCRNIPSKHSHIGPISVLCRNIDVGFRYRADIYNCTVKFFFQLLSIQWIINVNPFSLLYCKHITQVCQSIDQH